MPLISVKALIKPIATVDSLHPSTFRDFSGLWNTADNDLNLKVSFCSKLTNMERGTDGALKVRYGNRLFSDVSIPRNTPHVVVTGVIGTNQLNVQWVNHGLSAGSLVRLAGLDNLSYMGLSAAQLGSFLPVVAIVDEDNFTWQLPQFTTGTATNITSGADEQAVTGNIIDVVYFEGFLVAVTDAGYVVSVDGTSSARVIWSPLIGYIQTMTTVRTGTRLDTTVGSSQIVVNDPLLVAVPGQIVTLSGYVAIGGIPAAEINRSHLITQVGVGTYVLTLSTAANATVSGTGQLTYSVSSAWHSPFFCSHAVFNRQLLLCNGIDKPLRVDFAQTPVCQYLIDLGGVTNINTPIGLYVAAGTDYTVIAGNALAPGTIYISAKGTNGTFVGDIAPNDATNIDVGKAVNTPSPAITGIAFHRSLLFITFENHIVAYQLGQYDTNNNHVPVLQDVIENYGCAAHKSMLSVGLNFFICDFIGVINVQRNIFQNLYTPQRTSEVIGPHISKVLSKLNGNQTTYGIWSVYDKREGRYWLGVPNPAGGYFIYVYTFLEERKIYGWQLFMDQDWSCACRSEFDRIFGCSGTKIFVHGNDTDPIYTDDNAPIRFVSESPWIDFSKRMAQKQSRYIQLDTDGTSEFKVSMYVDRVYDDVAKLDSDLAANPAIIYDDFTYPTTPELQLDLAAAKAPGFGRGQQPYGGGRRTSRAGLITFPATFDICKIRIEGAVSGPLRLVGYTILYLVGSIRRGG